MAGQRRIFISYSQDSPNHKRWVAALAFRLLNRGFKITLDQWDLYPEDNSPAYIEEMVQCADWILAICSEEYTRKSDAGIGSIGFERMIVTPELINGLASKPLNEKVIAVIRQSTTPRIIPKCLGGCTQFDLSDDPISDDLFDRFILALNRHTDCRKPSGRYLNLPDDPIRDISDPDAIYLSAFKYAWQKDLDGWITLIDQVRPPTFRSLINWCRKYEKIPPNTLEARFDAMDEAIKRVAPSIMIALAGVESRLDAFKDQRALFDDLFNISGWNPSPGCQFIDLPFSLAYIYHSLHGALCLRTNQLDLAIGLADMKVKETGSRSGSRSVWQRHDLMGWPEILGNNCSEAWIYLAHATDRWHWLSEVFGNALEYRIALSAYYMALNVLELATMIADSGASTAFLHPDQKICVPLGFVSENGEVQSRAVALLTNNPDMLATLWSAKGVHLEQIRQAWPHWMSHCRRRIAAMSGYDVDLPHQGLFD